MDEPEFDQFAEKYEAQHRQNIAITGESPDFFAHYKISELSRFSIELPAPPSAILDFGSGTGNSVPFFRKFFPHASLTCADASSRCIELSQKRFPGHEVYAVINSDALPYEDNVFDVTFSACTFHHIPAEQHRHWLSEMRRVTRPGGLLVIFEHNPLNPLTVRAVNTCPFDRNAKLVRAATMARSTIEAGWTCSEVTYHIFFPRMLSTLRPLERHLGWLPLGAQYSIKSRKP